MNAYSVFAYGTMEHHKKTKTIITEFSNACTSTHSILSGPSLLGREVNSNALREVGRILEWLNQQEHADNRLNLTGFSRGAITCLYIANHLKQQERLLEKQGSNPLLLDKLKALKLNLFLIDPVAGPSAKGKYHARTIPDNVNSCVVVLQMDERRHPFKPQDMSRLIVKNCHKTQFSILPFYGRHQDVVKIKKANISSGPILIWHSLYHFLSHHGTQFRGDKIPPVASFRFQQKVQLLKGESPQEYLARFSKHHDERMHYFKRGVALDIWDGVGGVKIQRTFLRDLKYYVKNPDFFVNQLERELLKISYPKVFNFYFESNQYDSRFPDASCSSSNDVVLELAALEKNDVLLYRRLQRYLLLNERRGGLNDKPMGFSYLEPCISVQQIFPDLVPIKVKEKALSFNELALLEREVYRMTFQYQREKSAWNVFGKRSRSDHALAIRQEIYTIVNELGAPQDRKKELLLDALEKHYIDLILSGYSCERDHRLSPGVIT